MNNKNAVAIDIGGTTSDISLIIAGKTLYASRGAKIEGHLTHVNSFAVKSIALGGDSTLWIDNGELRIGPYRSGPAACFGGPQPSITDAFNLKFKLGIGDDQKSKDLLADLSERLRLPADNICDRVIDTVIDRLSENVAMMFREWENEPAYKVWEVVNKRSFELQGIIGIGAAAPAIIPLLAARLKVDYLLHKYSPVANALGAAVVRPTLAVNMHIDTQLQTFVVDPGGAGGTVENAAQFQLVDAKKLAEEYLHIISRKRGMEEYTDEASFYLEEQFNIIRGWERAGKLFEIGIQIAPGFISKFKGVSV